MGRRRLKKLGLPSGVQEKEGVWYWQPTTKRERIERAALRAEALARGERLTIGCTLGPAGSDEARKAWAKVSGYAEVALADGTVNELLSLFEAEGVFKQANGEPRAETTVERYLAYVPILREKFGASRYAKTAEDVARGQALGPAEIQEFVQSHPHSAKANLLFAVLDNSFQFAISVKGRTTYNPCADVTKNPGGVRDREPLAWEVECLRVLAKPRLGLQMDFEAITGWRISGILELKRAQGTADGVRVKYKKRGKRWLWEWSPELRRIWREAEDLRGATRFGASPVFPTIFGTELSYEGFSTEWDGLKKATNAALRAGVIDITAAGFQVCPGLQIEDLTFHDLRSKAHDDAEDDGRQGNDFLGNTAAVARRHYRRRARRIRPLK